jgi:hypothetical protein
MPIPYIIIVDSILFLFLFCTFCNRYLQHDPEGQWGKLKLAAAAEEDEDGEDAMPSVAAKFPYCLIDSSLHVRLYVVSTMKR